MKTWCSLCSSHIRCICPQIGEYIPGFIFESEKFVGGPIYGKDFKHLTVTQSWYSKWEYRKWQLGCSLRNVISIAVQWQTFCEVFTTESAHYHDWLTVVLGCTQSLSGSDGSGITCSIFDVNYFPHGVQILEWLLDVDSFDSRHVPACCVWYSAKDIYKLVIEFTACVVMATLIHLWKVTPFILR